MHDNPPQSGDNKQPQEQSQPNQQPPEEAQSPETDASLPPQLPHTEEDVYLKGPDLNYAGRLYTGDSASDGMDDSSTPDSPLDSQLRRAKALLRKSGGRDRYLYLDPLTRFERAIDVLTDRLPDQHPKLPDILLVCSRLQENIDYCRCNGKSTDNTAERNAILASLDALSMAVINISFHVLSQVAVNLDDEDNEVSKDLPRTQRDVARWYGDLNWFERCYVIAACVLQGAPSHEVSRAAHDLYTLIEQTYPPAQSTSRDEHRESLSAMGPVFISAEEVLRHTHTVTWKRDGDSAERIMWCDEAFDPLVREFLARQATAVGMRFANRNLLDILEEWVVSGNSERAMRAGRMLAELWWRQHRDKVLELAETWAHRGDENIWMAGATLLYGAYAAEQAETPGMKAAGSVVLLRLHEWADWRDDAGMAQVAAYTYGLLGRQWPEAALDGLDYLLCLGASARTKNTSPPLPVVFLAMLSYVEMASLGQIRPLLKRFASHAAHYGRRSLKNRAVFEDEQVRRTRERGLDMLFFHVVFLVALSMSGVQGKRHLSYLVNSKLSPRPDLPSSRGQDVLLAGVLASPEHEWRASVQTLFCAAISSGREQLVFEILASWIRIVTYEPRGDATEALVRFVAGLHRQLRLWDRGQQRGGLWAGSSLLEQRLLLWTKATREYVLRPFAQRALEALNK